MFFGNSYSFNIFFPIIFHFYFLDSTHRFGFHHKIERFSERVYTIFYYSKNLIYRNFTYSTFPFAMRRISTQFVPSTSLLNRPCYERIGERSSKYARNVLDTIRKRCLLRIFSIGIFVAFVGKIFASKPGRASSAFSFK